MDKKGAVIHWILFAVLGAIGLFTIISMNPETRERPGEWPLHFLQENYFPAEQEQLKIEIKARQIGQESVLELAVKGGFLDVSPCGADAGINQYNDGKKWCWPDVQNNGQQLVGLRLKSTFPGLTFSPVQFKDRMMMTKGSILEVTASNASYSYSTSFAVDLGYSLGEYYQLFRQAEILVNNCQQQNELNKCVDGKKPTGWQVCREVQEDNSSKVLVFCVDSQSQGFYSSKGDLVKVKYRFGLDFSGSSVSSMLV